MIPTSMQMPERFRIHTTSAGCRIYDYKVFDYVKEDGKYLLFKGHVVKNKKGSDRFVTPHEEASEKLHKIRKGAK